MNLELTFDEATLISSLLDRDLRDLKAEIYHTDTLEYRAQLKARERLMLGLLDKLGHLSVGPAGVEATG